MKRLLTILASAIVLAAIYTAPVMAVGGLSEDADIDVGVRGFIGAGVLSKPDYEGADKQTTIVAPFGTYISSSGRYIGLAGVGNSESVARLKLNAIARKTSKTWTMGPVLQYRLKRNDDVDDSQVKRMKEVDAATELGAFVNFRSGAFSGDLSFARDVSDKHDGYLMYLKGSYTLLNPSDNQLVLTAATTWADSNYMDAYFGVNASNVGTSGLPFYKPDSGFKDARISLLGTHSFNKSWTLAANLTYNRLLNDAEDSPLVEGNQGVGDKNQIIAALALVYVFR